MFHNTLLGKHICLGNGDWGKWSDYSRDKPELFAAFDQRFYAPIFILGLLAYLLLTALQFMHGHEENTKRPASLNYLTLCLLSSSAILFTLLYLILVYP